MDEEMQNNTMNKRTYKKPDVELVVFNYTDVMAASGESPLSTWLIDDDSSGTPEGKIGEDAVWETGAEVSDPDAVDSGN